MHCASCSTLIKRRLGKLSGVTHADVSYAAETASVTFNPQHVGVDAMNAEIGKLGYHLTSTAQSHPKQIPTHGNDHAAHTGMTQTADEKQAELQQLKEKTAFIFPLALLIFAVMIWDIAAMFSWLPPFPIPMAVFNPIAFAIASVALFWTGKPYIDAVGRFIRYRAANMDTLVGIGTLTAYLYSAAFLLFPQIHRFLSVPEGLYFDVTIVVIGFITLGKFLEARSKLQTGEAIEKLIHLSAKSALVLRNGKEMEIPVEEVLVGDILIIKPGQKIPVDATITRGTTAIDESMITGEPLPVDKKPGDTIIGATINSYGSIQATAIKVGSDTMLAHIIQMVRDAQSSKAPIERLADTVSSVFVPVILVLSILTLVFWFFMGNISLGILSFVGILVIACPCAMGLATPTAIIVGVGKAAEQGILIKNAESLEKLSSVSTIVLDKTGTITEGKPSVTDITPVAARGKSRVLSLLASLENLSEHPLAHAIVHKAKEQNLPLSPVSRFTAISGKGLAGDIQRKTYYAGNTKLASDLGISWDKAIVDAFASEGKTPILLMSKTDLLAYVALADTLKKNVKETMQDLHRMHLTVTMLTGDSEKTARAIARQAGIDTVIAEVLPADKASEIKKLQTQGQRVVMVGDGINDAPALATADVGIAMGTGTDVAIESAGITLLGGTITKLPRAVALARLTMRTIKQNLFWAFFYNVVSIPVAAGVLYPILGIMLNPAIAGAAMALSSVSVVANSLRLKSARITNPY